MNESSAISIFNIDTNLMSGSSDLFRNAIGMHWMVVGATEDFDDSTEAGNVLLWRHIAQESPKLNANYAATLDNSGQGHTLNFFTPNSMLAEAKWLGADHVLDDMMAVSNQTTILSSSNKSFLPNYKFGMRVVSTENKFVDDEEWLTYLKGGTYYTSSYTGIYSPETFDVYNFKNLAPYSVLDAKRIDPENYQGYSTYNIQANYNHHYPLYENKLFSLNSSLLIPSVYFLDFMSTTYNTLVTLSDREIKKFLGPDLTDFIGMNTDPSEIRSLMQGKETNYLPPYPITEKDMGSYLNQSPGKKMYFDKSENLRNFLTGTFVNNTYEPSTEAYATEKFKNLLFTNAAVQNHYNPLQLKQNVLDRFPAYISIEVPRNKAGTITNLIAEQKLENLFISMLRAEFESGLTQQHQTTAKIKSDALNQYGAKMSKTSVRNTTYRSADLFDMMLRGYNKTTKQAPQDELYIEPQGTYSNLLLTNENGVYRYASSIPMLNFMKQCVSNIQENGIVQYSTDPALECPKLEVGDQTYSSYKFWMMGKNTRERGTSTAGDDL